MTNEEIAAAIRAELPPMSDHPPYEGSPRAKLLALADQLDPPAPPPVLDGCLWDFEAECWAHRVGPVKTLVWQLDRPGGLWVGPSGTAYTTPAADLTLHVWPPPPTLSMGYDDALAFVLDKHRKWLWSTPAGRRLDLAGADLRSADLSGADLSDAVRPEGWPT